MTLSRSQTTGCNKWWITNLGTVSRKENKYLSFCRSSKRCEKMKLHTSSKTACHCLCWCFSRKFFICWLKRPTFSTSNTWNLAANCLTLRCQTWWLLLPWLCRWDMHWKTHYMTTGWDSDSYTIRFMTRPWRDRIIHILCFLHFPDNSHRPDEGKEYDRLWKLRTVFDKLNMAYAKFYNPSEHLAVDEVIVKLKAGLSSGSIFQRNENVSASKFTNSVMNQAIHMT